MSTSHIIEGTISSLRDTRLMERRKTLHTNLKQERRVRDNRNHAPRWNTMSHHILVIALKRKTGAPEPWKAGDRLLVLLKNK